MINLIITHLTHPWGPPWTLETLGGPWRPLATLGDMLENDHFGGNSIHSLTTQGQITAHGRCVPLRGVQRPNSLEYQTSTPTPFDTLVAGLSIAASVFL